jgi:mannan endo-1,4-beta-mannosidase
MDASGPTRAAGTGADADNDAHGGAVTPSGSAGAAARDGAASVGNGLTVDGGPRHQSPPSDSGGANISTADSGSGSPTPGDAGAVRSGGPWKVMMLGDSITGSTCYPQLVSKGLIAQGHTNFQFVGTQKSQQSCNAAQVLTEGHGGYGVTYLPKDNARTKCAKSACGTYAELQAWAAEKPEIVLMHYGTNDVWDGQSTASILEAYASVIAEFRKQQPNVTFFVSKISKLNPSGCQSCVAGASALAAALDETWASNHSLPNSPVSVIDSFGSAFDPNNAADTADGVHPTQAGAQKIATVAVAAVIAENYF